MGAKLENIEEGVIDEDSKAGKILGFTSDKFSGYLARVGDTIYISTVWSLFPGKGNLSKLFDRIFQLGFTIKVPSASGHMEEILVHKKFKRTYENDERLGRVRVWVKKPRRKCWNCEYCSPSDILWNSRVNYFCDLTDRNVTDRKSVCREWAIAVTQKIIG